VHLDEGCYQIMLPEAKIDYVFVETVAYAHLLLEKALLREQAAGGKPGADAAGGQVFCVSNEEPMVADDFINSLQWSYQELLKRPFQRRYLPMNLMKLIAWCVEFVERLTQRRISGQLEKLTPAMLAIAELSYTFSSAKARQVLGYEPLFTVDEAVQRTVHLWHKRKAEASMSS